MKQQPILAAVDLGSNSFRLQIARVENDQLYMLDSLREPVRLAAGLTEDKRLDKAAQQRALVCLQRFGERLRDLPREAVRAVGTNSLRVAKNAAEFLQQAEAALGDGYRRRLHRIHYRQRAGATKAGKPVHGMRQLQPALFSRRQDQ